MAMKFKCLQQNLCSTFQCPWSKSIEDIFEKRVIVVLFSIKKGPSFFLLFIVMTLTISFIVIVRKTLKVEMVVLNISVKVD